MVGGTERRSPKQLRGRKERFIPMMKGGRGGKRRKV